MRATMGTEFGIHWQDRPLTVVDVGARWGVSERWAPARPNLSVIAFEPDPEECRRLQESADPAVRYLPTALADVAGNVPLNVTRNGDTTSLLEPNREFIDEFPDADRFDVLSVVTVGSDTLDSALSKNGVAEVDVVKIDTQGSELQILSAGRNTLRQAFALEVETEFDRLYVGQPLFRDVDEFADGLGFRLFDLQCRRWKRKRGVGVGGPKGQLVFADALYFKRESSWREVLEQADGDAATRLLHALAVCLLYGYADYALSLLDHCGGVLPAAERGRFEEAVRKDAGRANPRIKGVGRIANMLRSMAENLDPGLHGWATSDRHLGNR